MSKKLVLLCALCLFSILHVYFLVSWLLHSSPILTADCISRKVPDRCNSSSGQWTVWGLANKSHLSCWIHSGDPGGIERSREKCWNCIFGPAGCQEKRSLQKYGWCLKWGDAVPITSWRWILCFPISVWPIAINTWMENEIALNALSVELIY